MEQEGCLCWIPAKASVPSSDCWAYAIIGIAIEGAGWPALLNGSEIERLLQAPKGP